MSNRIQKLVKMLKSAGDLREEVDILNELSILVVDDDAAKSLEYSKKARELAETILYKDGIAYAVYNHGMYKWREGEYMDAIKQLSHSINVQSGDDLELQARIHTGLGIVYYTYGNYDLALSWYLKALGDLERTDLAERQSACLHNIGMIYTELAEYQTALEYLRRSLHVLDDEIEETDDAHILDTLADLFRRMGHHTEALMCANRSLDLSRAENNLTLTASTTTNLANIHAAREEWDEAERYALEAIDIFSRIDDKRGLANCCTEWAANLITHDEPADALEYLDRAAKIAGELDSRPLFLEIYKTYSDAHDRLGDQGKALKYFRQYHEIREQVLTKGMLEQIDALNAEYSAEKNRRESEIHQLKNIELARAQTIASLGSWEWHSITGKITGSDEFYRIIDREHDTNSLILNELLKSLHPDFRDRLTEIFDSFSAETEDDSALLKSLRTDGEERIVRLQWSVHQDSVTAASFCIVGTLQDVTELEKAKEALEQSEERYRAVVEQSGDCIFLIDLKSRRVLEANKSAQNLLGFSPEEFMSMKLYDFVAHSKSDVNKKIKILVDQGENFFGEREYLRRDGSRVEVEVMVSLIKFGGADVMCVVSRDITNRKQAQQELRREKEFTSGIIQTSPAFIVVINENGTVRMMNQAMLDALGYNEDEVTSEDYIEKFVPTFEWEGLKSELNRLKETRESIPTENYVLRCDGRPLRVEWRGVPIFDEHGNYSYYCGVGVDITQRKRAEDRLNSLVSNAPDVILYQTGTGERFISSNIKQVMGYEPDEITSDSEFFLTIFHPDDRKRIEKARKEWVDSGAEGTLETEFRARRVDGDYIWLLDRMTCAFRTDDQQYTFFGVMTNITDLKEVEAEREKLIEELKEAASRINVLSGLVPICSGCKKIRDDSGYWNQLEEFISEHSDAVFSHGLCPVCARELYPEVYDEIDKKSDDGSVEH